jgi:hypothetical protein
MTDSQAQPSQQHLLQQCWVLAQSTTLYPQELLFLVLESWG